MDAWDPWDNRWSWEDYALYLPQVKRRDPPSCLDRIARCRNRGIGYQNEAPWADYRRRDTTNNISGGNFARKNVHSDTVTFCVSVYRRYTVWKARMFQNVKIFKSVCERRHYRRVLKVWKL